MNSSGSGKISVANALNKKRVKEGVTHMARQPRQVHIYLYRQRGGAYEYAIFRRADMPECFQGVCGGGEGDETLEQAARREVFEEAGVTGDYPMHRLTSISNLPDTLFSTRARAAWGKGVCVVLMYFFAAPFDGEIALSDEHTQAEWLCYDEAYARVTFEDQKIALYELNERLTRGVGFAERMD